MPDTATISGIRVSTILGRPCTVVLFNDEDHTMTEVVVQIIKAIHCSSQEAHRIMMEAHTTGRAVVFTGARERCEHVEAVLSETGLGTEIEAV